jgi:TolB-like protein/Tfp pilus assembly protein PilF
VADEALLHAAGRIADGDHVDWLSITATLVSDRDRAIADELALVQQIAAGHRQLHQLLPANADTPPHLVPDRARWGHLDLLNVVGRGSYGMVYRAWDTRLERLVALKLFHGAADPETVMQEGRMLARVRHEHVVTVFGADVIDGVAGIWMELVHGQTLDLIVRKSGPFPPSEAAAIGGEVAKALAAVHAAGLLHCDVKAQNVVRETTGRVVLMDLGAGRLAPEMRDDGEQLSDIAGTPRYMAPELFVAGAAPTKATDIYSLGVLIYFLVAGEYPTDGKTLGDLRRAHEAGRIRKLSSIRKDLPRPLLEIVDRSLDPDQSLRPATATDVHAALAAATAVVNEQPVEVPQSRAGWWALVAAGVAVIAILLIGPLLRSPGPALPAEESIAVLPIKNLTGDSAQQYLADGLTEVLTAHLARLPGLHVASSATMAMLRGTTDSDRVLAEKLGVRLLLAGSVIQAGERIGLSINLTDPRAGRAIWGTELERLPSNILSARSEIAALVAARLSLKVPAALPNDASRQLQAEAQDAYLRGMVEFNSTSNTRMLAGVDLLKRAVALEPEWSDPLALLAFAQQRTLEFGDPAQRRERAEIAKANALRAIQLDPGVPTSYTALAAVQAYHDWDFTAAEATLRQGLEASPREALGHTRLALLLSAAGRLPEAIVEAERARDLEPLIPERYTTLGIIRYYARDFDRALEDMQRALAVAPNYKPAIFGTGRILMGAGRLDDAIRSLQAVSDPASVEESPVWLAHLGMAYASLGRASDVAAVVARLREQEARGRFISIDNYAYIAMNQGRLDEAFALLDEAVNRRMTNILWLAVDPRADVIRADPRFDALIARMGLVRK